MHRRQGGQFSTTEGQTETIETENAKDAPKKSTGVPGPAEEFELFGRAGHDLGLGMTMPRRTPEEASPKLF